MNLTDLGVYFALGSITSTLGFLYGLGVRPNLLARVDDWIHAKIETEINNFLESVESDPQIVERLMKVVRPYVEKEITRFISKISGGTGEEMKDLKIGGVKIPAWAVQMGIGFLNQGKKRAQNELLGAASNIIDIGQ